MFKNPLSAEIQEAIYQFTLNPRNYLDDHDIADVESTANSSEVNLIRGKTKVKVTAFSRVGREALVRVSSTGRKDDFGVGGIDALPFITRIYKQPGLVLTNLRSCSHYHGPVALSEVTESCLGYDNKLIDLSAARSKPENAIEVPGLLSNRVYEPTLVGSLIPHTDSKARNTFGWNISYKIYRPFDETPVQGRRRFTFPSGISSGEQMIEQLTASVQEHLSGL